MSKRIWDCSVKNMESHGSCLQGFLWESGHWERCQGQRSDVMGFDDLEIPQELSMTFLAPWNSRGVSSGTGDWRLPNSVTQELLFSSWGPIFTSNEPQPNLSCVLFLREPCCFNPAPAPSHRCQLPCTIGSVTLPESVMFSLPSSGAIYSLPKPEYPSKAWELDTALHKCWMNQWDWHTVNALLIVIGCLGWMLPRSQTRPQNQQTRWMSARPSCIV